MTTSPSALLPIRSGASLLAFVRGHLVDRAGRVMNGWIVPRAPADRRLVLVETSALIMAILEIAGACCVLYVLVRLRLQPY